MNTHNRYSKGLLDGLPIGIGYLSVSFAFGIIAARNGLSVLEALLISMTNLTSAGQLAGVPIIAGGGSLAELALTQLVINSRYALMSVALSQKLSPSVNLPRRLLVAYGNTDEIFAVATSKDGLVGSRYFYGLMTLPFVGWSGGTLLGALAGSTLPEIVSASLGVAIYAMLIAVVVPKGKKHRPTALCILLSIFLSCLFRYLPILSDFTEAYGGFVIIISAVTASLLFAWLCPINVEPTTGKEDSV